MKENYIAIEKKILSRIKRLIDPIEKLKYADLDTEKDW